MIEIEYLLICLMEEAAEIQVAASKALRFGMDNHHPDRPEQCNKHELNIEIGDVMGVLTLLKAADVVDIGILTTQSMIKMEKVRQYMELSRDIGIVEEK